MSTHHTAPVRYDTSNSALTIRDLTVTHPTVTTEALRWSTGSRGPLVSAGEAGEADLTAYAEQALVVGAQAIAAAGGAQDTFDLEQLIQHVGVRTAEATATAMATTDKAIDGATQSIRQVSSEVRKTLTEANETARDCFTKSVQQARSELQSQVLALFGGEDPQVASKLSVLLANFGADLAQRTDKQTSELFQKATRVLDPADPTSPLARHQQHLTQQYTDLTEHLDRQHTALAKGVEDIKSSLTAQQAAAQVATKLAFVTPLKGSTYEAKVHALLHTLAIGLGDEYAETGTVTGTISRCRKGDGVLTVMGGAAKVVIEMSTTKAPRDWTSYLEEAETNRAANASIGLVPNADANAGQSVRTLGPRRVVVAFDPEVDDSAILRLAVQILRIAALAEASSRGTGAVRVAREHVSDALSELARLQKVRRAASAITKQARTIDTEAERLATSLNRILLQAQTALVESATVVDAEDVASGASDPGAA